MRERPNFFDGACARWGCRWSRCSPAAQQRTSQEREQWSSACNFLAVAPGHDRELPPERATLCELEAAGFRVVPAVNFLAFDDWTDAKHRTVITIEGSRAGPRAAGARAACRCRSGGRAL